MQVLTEKNTQLSQELEECKTQLRAAVAALKEPKSPQLVTFVSKNDRYHIVCGVAADLTIDIADESGGPACRTTAKGWRTHAD